ncbi:tetratricopeptide repeat protein [Bosea sp. (in: a-proteobacteria)]|uniref:tetratricopeptide repeat protein n=1 Tax=Bosea sp. (in: a-proteobacteria) TaxID=1871050 RepID=UPI002FC825DA
MASQQRVALFILFDACERDLVARLRGIALDDARSLLNEDERERARGRRQRRENQTSVELSDTDLLFDLDLGDKFAILLRHKASLDESARSYYQSIFAYIEKAIPVRNSVMHGRPLTTIEYVTGFEVSNKFRSSPVYWPLLDHAFKNFESDPKAFIASAINALDVEPAAGTLHNLPEPDYDDTGFLPRPDLEKELRKKLSGRNPVVTVLGDGGNGKTALALQVLYGMVASNDHPFDAIVWVSAKSARLGTKEIERVEGAITNSLGLFEQVAEFEPGSDGPIDRVRRLMSENTVLLVIDNLETVLDESIINFAADIPGDSKLLLTSRVPLGSDLTVNVGEFSQKEAKAYLYRLIEAFGVNRLRKLKADQLDRHIVRLGRKPLLLKWFTLGVIAGLEPDQITSNPEIALQFCMENVVDKLQPTGRQIAAVMAALPSGVSPIVLHHVTDLSAPLVELGLSELLRFALVERDHKWGDERVYVLKPFVRSYIARVIKRVPAEASAILSRYRGVEAAFQVERGHFERYETNSFVVRSRSEAVASRRLRHAIALLVKYKFEEAEAIVSDLKVTSPEYFEIYRVEAFLAERQGDVTRAKSSYETGVELGDDQPQMHYRFALFLGRAFGDHPAAFDHFSRALDLDRDTFILYREMVRNRFFEYDFVSAQQYIDQVKNLDLKSVKERIVINDLQAQRFYREADILLRRKEFGAAADSLKALSSFLETVDESLVDSKFVEHLGRVFSLVDQIKRSNWVPGRHGELDDLVGIIERFSPIDSSIEIKSAKTEIYTGNLKKEGLKPEYGFLKDVTGREVYVKRDRISPSVWTDMCAGRTVQFQIAVTGWGATYAINVDLV